MSLMMDFWKWKAALLRRTLALSMPALAASPLALWASTFNLA